MENARSRTAIDRDDPIDQGREGRDNNSVCLRDGRDQRLLVRLGRKLNPLFDALAAFNTARRIIRAVSMAVKYGSLIIVHRGARFGYTLISLVRQKVCRAEIAGEHWVGVSANCDSKPAHVSLMV
jgi:ribosomal protein RSM22 (predicted rRNA methylase)